MAVIDLITKYTQAIDEKFSTESKAERCINKDFDFVGAKTVKVYNVSTAPMGDYEREGTSRYGTPSELDASTQEMTMAVDRSFTFTIDKMNEEETGGVLNAGKALARQLREVVIPEIDTYRFKKMCELAGTKATALTLTATNIYDAVLAATTVLDDKEVPEEGRFMVVTPQTYELLKKSKDITLETDLGAEQRKNGVIAMVDGMGAIIKVPSKRLPENTGFLVGHAVATTAPVKLAEYKVHTDVPGISGSLVEGRVYYDAFVLENKKVALYYHANATTTKAKA